MNAKPTLLLAALLTAALAHGGAAAELVKRDPAEVRIVVTHPDFVTPPKVTVLANTAIRGANLFDWVVFGKLNAPEATMSVSYQTHGGKGRFEYRRITERLREQEALVKHGMPEAVGPVATAASPFGEVEWTRIRQPTSSGDRECAYWLGHFNGTSSRYLGWYCPALGQPVTDAAALKAINSARLKD